MTMFSFHSSAQARASSQPSSKPQPEFNPTTYVRRLLGENAAVVWERIRWWVEHNKKQGCRSHYRNGYWWSWNSYELWIQDKELAKHSLTRRQFQTAIQRLKGAGLIVVERHRAEGKLFGFYRTIDPVGCGIAQAKQAGQPSVREPDRKVMNILSPALSVSDLHSKKSWTRSGRDLDMSPIYIQSNSLPPYHSAPGTSDVHNSPCKKNLERQASNILKDMNSALPACPFKKVETSKSEVLPSQPPNGEVAVTNLKAETHKPAEEDGGDKGPHPLDEGLWEVMKTVGPAYGLDMGSLRSLYRTALARGFTASQWQQALYKALSKQPDCLGALLHKILKQDHPDDMDEQFVLRSRGKQLEKQLEEVRSFASRAQRWLEAVCGCERQEWWGDYKPYYAKSKPGQGKSEKRLKGAKLYYPSGEGPHSGWIATVPVRLDVDSPQSVNQAIEEWAAAVVSHLNMIEDDEGKEPDWVIGWITRRSDNWLVDAETQRLMSFAEQNVAYWSGGGRNLTRRGLGSVGECYPEIAAHPAYLWCTKTDIRAYVWDHPEDFQRKVQQMAQAYDYAEFVGRPKFIMPKEYLNGSANE